MRYAFHSEHWFGCPIELVFAFFANLHNLPRLMPVWQKARIENSVYAPPPPRPVTSDPALRLQTLAAGVGSGINISFHPFPHAPFRISWQAEIAEFIWNHHICDIQVRGPFSFWRHYHRLQSETRRDESGAFVEGTLLRDDIEYSPPFGPLGALAQTTVIEPQLRTIFAYRHERTSELLNLIHKQF